MIDRRKLFVVAPLLTLLAIWVGGLVLVGAISGGPGSRDFGEDFNVYLSAAHVLKSGGNIYDASRVFVTEQTLLHQAGLQVYEPRALVRVASPPLFFWLLQPLTALPLRAAVLCWELFTLALAAIGFLAALRSLGWQRVGLAVLIFLAMPATLEGILYGEVTALYLFSTGIALALAESYPALAGAVLTMAWLKPPVALPVALLVLLFYGSNTRKLFVGFTVATIAELALTLVTTGPSSLEQWMRGLASFSNDMAQQPTLVSLSGVYVALSPVALRSAIEVLSVGLALALTVLWRHRTGPTPTPVMVAWLWPCWLLLVPYLHFPDEMLLAIPIAVLVGRDGTSVARPLPALVMYVMVFSPWIGLWPVFGLRLGWAVLVVVLGALLPGALRGLALESHEDEARYLKGGSRLKEHVEFRSGY